MGDDNNYVGRKTGYVRVSTDDQDTRMQRDALIKDGVPPERIFEEKASGGSQDRKGLNRVLKIMWPGDILVVWKLDRLGRSLSGLIQTVEYLEQEGIKFRSITEQFDTSTPGGKMIMQVMMVLAEFERNLIAERTKEGIKAFKKRGGKMGPKHRIRDYPKRLAKFTEIDVSGDVERMTGSIICEELNKIAPKDLPISVQSLNNWKAGGFRGYKAPKGSSTARGMFGKALEIDDE